MDLNPKLAPVTLDSFGEGELVDLDDRTGFILRMRSGIWDGELHTLREVGEEISLHRSRVQVLERDGLKVIRQSREFQRHLREEPVSVRYRWRLPRSVAERRWIERHR